MNKNTAIVTFKNHKNKTKIDLEVPLDITANELVNALNEAYSLEIDVSDIKNCYLQAERPITLLKGSKTLAECGICNGSIINFTK